MNFGLIIVGDEILSGKRQDKHLAKVIELLGARGLALAWARYLGDDRARITAALRMRSPAATWSSAAAASAPRPTTTPASALPRAGRPLVLHPEARALILQRMRDVAARAGRALRARPARQPAPAEHGRVPGRRGASSQPVQQDPRLQRSATCTSCPASR
jgi:hypothetical protein